jgi:exonuclease III
MNHGPDPHNLLEEFYNLKPDFNYYDIHNFHKLTNNLPKSKQRFSLFHTNIQSLNHNFDYLKILLNALQHNFDIIALTETWNPLDKITFLPGTLQGYSAYQGTKGHTLKSGCGLYIKNSLKHIERNDLTLSFSDNNNEFQSYWIEIVNKNSANIIVGTFYRHPKPTSDNTFNEQLSLTLNKLINCNKIVIITGDFNYDLFKTDTNPIVKTFIETMYSHMIQPCILEPTRIVNTQNPSLIDNIFINTIEKDIKSGNLTSKVSDHLPNFIIVSDLLDKLPKTKQKIRNFKNFKLDSFNEDVSNIPINLDTNPNNVDSLFSDFHDNFVRNIDKHAPLTTITLQEMKWKQVPWVNKGIQNLIKIRDTIHRKYLRQKSTFWFNRFKYYRNMIKKLIFSSKKNYYKNYFEKHKSNSKKI